MTWLAANDPQVLPWPLERRGSVAVGTPLWRMW